MLIYIIASFICLITASHAHAKSEVTRVDPRYVVDVPMEWWDVTEASGRQIRLRRSGLTPYVLVNLMASASQDVTRATTLDAAVQELKQVFIKSGWSHGAPQRLTVPGGEARWIEAAGMHWPYAGAVSRGGKFFFVRVVDLKRQAADFAGLREAFLSTLRNVRPFTREDTRVSPEFSQAAKAFLDLIFRTEARESPGDPGPDLREPEQRAKAAWRTPADKILLEALRKYESLVQDQQILAVFERRTLLPSPEERQDRNNCRQEIERVLQKGVVLERSLACPP